MAFADPQSVTINAVAISLPRTGIGPSSGNFTSADKTLAEVISHRNAKGRDNRMIRFNYSKIAPDVYTSDNKRYDMSVWLVVDVPETGFTVAEQKLVTDGVLAYLTASSGAKMTQLLGGEV
jgi:hypothetical protein